MLEELTITAPDPFRERPAPALFASQAIEPRYHTHLSLQPYLCRLATFRHIRNSNLDHMSTEVLASEALRLVEFFQ